MTAQECYWGIVTLDDFICKASGSLANPAEFAEKYLLQQISRNSPACRHFNLAICRLKKWRAGLL